MSPPRIVKLGEEGRERFIPIGERYYFSQHLLLDTGSGKWVEVEGVESLKDGYRVLPVTGTSLERVLFRAGHLPQKDRIQLMCKDFTRIIPVRESEVSKHGPRPERR